MNPHSQIGAGDPDVSVVIVTWNSGANLSHCLSRLGTQTFKNFEVIIVDNGSTDGSVNSLEGQYPDLNIKIRNLGNNLGFAAANNIGAHLAHGKWLALLNTDAFPESTWLEELLSASKNYDNYTSFSSRQIQANNPAFLDGAGDAYHTSGLAWRINLGYPADDYGLEFTELFSPCAAAAMYLREAFLAVDGFDETFFSYFEDVDLGFRMQLKGYRCLYVPRAVVHHVGSATFGEKSDFAFYYSHRNLIWTFIKNMPEEMFWRYLPTHIISNLIYLVYYSVQGRGRILWQAKLDAVRGLSKSIHKRQEIQKQNRVKISELESRMQHGWFKPYLLGYNLRKVLRNKNL